MLSNEQLFPRPFCLSTAVVQSSLSLKCLVFTPYVRVTSSLELILLFHKMTAHVRYMLWLGVMSVILLLLARTTCGAAHRTSHSFGACPYGNRSVVVVQCWCVVTWCVQARMKCDFFSSSRWGCRLVGTASCVRPVTAVCL